MTSNYLKFVQSKHDCDATGGRLDGLSCVLPPPPPAPVQIIVSAPPIQPEGDIISIITSAALAHGISAEWMIRVARCESGLNIYAHNPSGATGLFQFMPGTFVGNGGVDIYDPTQQANVAAKMFANGQSYQWSCK
jgi:hypothetical protein